MKCCVIFLFFGLAVQLDASAIELEKLQGTNGDKQLITSTMHFDARPSTPVERDGSTLDQKQQTDELDEDAYVKTDNTTSAKNPEEGVAEVKQDKKDSRSDRRRHRHKKHSRRSDNSESSQVLAVGLDTGAPGSQNGIVQAISEAFGGLNILPQHARSNYNGDKSQPLSLELKSETLLRALENFLASSKVKKLTRDLARKAAVIYRAFEMNL